MGIAISIISEIIKLVVNNKVENEVISQTIGILADDALKKEANDISEFINSEKAKIKKILSEEHLGNMHIPYEYIPYVIKEMELLLSIIEFTDKLWDENEYNPKKLEEYLWERYCYSKNGSLEYEEYIKKVINAIAKTLVDIKCNSDSFERGILIKIYTLVGNQKGLLQEIEASVNNIEKKIEEKNGILHVLSKKLSFIKSMSPESRTLEYAEKWNQNMFLNNFDEGDNKKIKKGISVRLGEVYPKGNSGFHLPHFISPKHEETQHNLADILADYINNSKKGKMLLILGQPGIGKSTLITWIAANYINVIDRIFIYRFASDLNRIDWQKVNGDVADEILKTLSLSYADLEGKVLIIDGFDEINVGHNKEEFLNDIYWNCTTNHFSVIITCRENYVNELDRLNCEYIKLCPWSKEQIQSFCTIYKEKTKCTISAETKDIILCNEKVFGMPLIVYMVLALGIDIKENSSIVDVYDQIFDTNGGIYQRCINKIRFERRSRLSDAGEQIHSISMKIAFWIFENNPDKDYISQEEYENICQEVINGNTLDNEDVLSGNYFEQIRHEHCNGTETYKICFVHNTIYIYFVAAYICSSIKKAAQKSEKELAGALGELFKQTALSNEILDFLRIEIRNSHLYEQFDLINGAFGLMLQHGMTYYTRQCYENAMKCEMLVFTNMLNFICLWEQEWSQSIFQTDSSYIRCNEYKRCLKMVVLKGIDLRGADLRGTNFEQAHLERAILNEVNLRESNLREAHLEVAELQRSNLKGADIFAADLTGAQLQEADLRDANLRGGKFDNADLDNAIVDDTQLIYIDKAKNLQNVRVYLTESKQIVSYEEYCKSIQ